MAAFLGSDALPNRPPARPQPERPTFVILGTIEARKNHLMLLQVWASISWSAWAHGAPRLLVIGQRGWECEQVVDLLDRSELLKGSVIEIKNCSDALLSNHLGRLMRAAVPEPRRGLRLTVSRGAALRNSRNRE